MKKILVPTDFSTYAAKALDYATGLIRITGGEIFLLHVCNQLNPKYSRHENLIKEYNDQEVRKLSGKLTQVQEELMQTGVRVHTLLYNGDITESVLWIAQQNGVDAIVMGTQGATGIKTAIFGTKTSSVIQESMVPVIAVPYNYVWKEPHHILIAINEAEEDPKLFDPVFKLASLFNAEVKSVVYSDQNAKAAEVMESSRVIHKAQQRLNKHFGIQNTETVHITGRDFHQTLQEYIEKNQIDLLVMVTHRRKFIQSLFKFSMTRQMAYHTTIPLMSLQSMQV